MRGIMNRVRQGASRFVGNYRANRAAGRGRLASLGRAARGRGQSGS